MNSETDIDEYRVARQKLSYTQRSEMIVKWPTSSRRLKVSEIVFNTSFKDLKSFFNITLHFLNSHPQIFQNLSHFIIRHQNHAKN